jgi:cytochrome c biogenesis factor
VNLIHLGLAVLALGILGVETLSGTYEGQLAAGSPIRVNGFEFNAGEFASSLDASGNVVCEVPVGITHGDTVREVRPAVIHFTKLGTLYARPGLAAGWLQDARSSWNKPASAEETYPVRIAFYPLITGFGPAAR